MASGSIEYDCDKGAGVRLDPNEHKRIGYITSFGGVGLSQPLTPDVSVNVPFNAGETLSWPGLSSVAPGPNASSSQTQVVGVIEKFAWDGGVGDPLKLDFYVSQANATQLKTLQQATLKTTEVSALQWWILDYDQEKKVWYEQSYPLPFGSAVTGILAGQGSPELNVDLSPVAVTTGSDVNVYKLSIQVAPGANQPYSLFFANSSQTRAPKTWGLEPGQKK